MTCSYLSARQTTDVATLPYQRINGTNNQSIVILTQEHVAVDYEIPAQNHHSILTDAHQPSPTYSHDSVAIPVRDSMETARDYLDVLPDVDNTSRQSSGNYEKVE